MSEDDIPSTSAPSNDATPQQPTPKRSFFEIPAALRRIFDLYPLVTYAENDLPLRAPNRERDENVLYVFATEEGARKGQASFNPGCLKWQTYLKLRGIPFRTLSSNNHASPSGALPFLLPASGETASTPVPSNKLKRWIASQSKVEKAAETVDVRLEAYQSLLGSRLRVAWLYQLYLNPFNAPLAHKLYVAAASSNSFVQLTIAHQLRAAAELEIVKSTGSKTLVESDILESADDALSSLSTLLDENEWFFGQEKPDLFDASVFAYTHLLLDKSMKWEDNGLGERLKKYENLVTHQRRIAEMYY